jgi:hypothetical protein
VTRELIALYCELTETDNVTVQLYQSEIVITIVSNWFHSQDLDERLEYLAEGIEVVYPHLLRRFRFHFVPLTPLEASRIKAQNRAC